MSVRMLLSTISTIALMAAAGPALAQTAPTPILPKAPATGAAAPATQAATSTAQQPGQPGAPALAAADQQFVNHAATSGMAEVAMAKLALTKADQPQVKQFAQRMVDDHTKANDQLMALAQQAGAQPPAGEAPWQQRAQDRLAAKSGPDFDRQYMRGQIRAHEQAVALFKKEAATGQNAQLKQFAASTLPTLQDHLAMAQSIAQQVGVPQVSMRQHPPRQGQTAMRQPHGQTQGSYAMPQAGAGLTADQLNNAEHTQYMQQYGAGQPAPAGQPQSSAAPAPAPAPQQGGLLAQALSWFQPVPTPERPCGPGSAPTPQAARVQPGAQTDSTKPHDANVAERRLAGC